MFDKITAREVGGAIQAIGGLKGFANNFNSAKTGGQKLMSLLNVMGSIGKS